MRYNVSMEQQSDNVAAPAVQVTVTTPNDKNKVTRRLTLALILCILIALGGVGFGIWALLDRNAQIASLEEQNSALAEQVESAEHGWMPNAIAWSSTEIRDGEFYVLDEHGDVITKSNLEGITINNITECTPSIDRTLLECVVETSAGDGWILYDVNGDSLSSSFEMNLNN